LLSSGREFCLKRSTVTFPSDALLSLWEFDLSLDMGFFGGVRDVAPVRRREDAEWDRDLGVKVQIDDLSGRENSSRMPFDGPKGRQEGVSCFLGERSEGRERL